LSERIIKGAPSIDKHTANSAIATIGIDLAKTVFQLHGIDVAGKVVLRRSMRRREFLALMAKLPPCVVGIEACAPRITGRAS
jgi:transposase